MFGVLFCNTQTNAPITEFHSFIRAHFFFCLYQINIPGKRRENRFHIYITDGWQIERISVRTRKGNLFHLGPRWIIPFQKYLWLFFFITFYSTTTNKIQSNLNRTKLNREQEKTALLFGVYCVYLKWMDLRHAIPTQISSTPQFPNEIQRG